MLSTGAEHLAYIALGSNIEPRLEHIEKAIAGLRACGEVIRLSTIIETAPVGYTEQADFLNGVLLLATALSPEGLWECLRGLEKSLGRVVRPRWHEREIDLDILFYDNAVITTEKLTIPHPELAHREFVLKPLAEIAPNFVHPVLHKSIRELFDQLHSETDLH